MIIKPLGSSSEGNAYLISDGETTIMLECGLPINDLKIKTGFFNPRPAACLISHSHGDHAKSVENLLAMGIDCYLSKYTMAELKIKSPFAHEMQEGYKLTIGSFEIQPMELKHDVYCLGFYIYSKQSRETLFFATDTYYIPYRFKNLDYIMVEANYAAEIVNSNIINGDFTLAAKERLVRSHLEIESTILWLKQQDLRRCKRIYLLHLSDGNSNKEDFKNRVIEAVGVPTTVCEK